jgi:hypothetical protein
MQNRTENRIAFQFACKSDTKSYVQYMLREICVLTLFGVHVLAMVEKSMTEQK